MPLKDSYNNQIKGLITRTVRDRNLKIVERKSWVNLVTYSATNLLAKAISGDNTVKISHIRVGGVLTTQYAAAQGNSTTFSEQTPARTDTDMYYAGNHNPTFDFVLSIPVAFLAFSGDQTGPQAPPQQTQNVATYQAILDFNVGNSYTFDELGMFGASDTVMFSHANVDPIGKTSAFQIEYEWALIFR